MLGIIENWLFDQIGLNCKLDNLNESNIFQDGCVIANILKRYGLIDGNIALYITTSNDNNQCFSNLKMLKPVIEALHINFADSVINEIVQNKLSTTIQLLYELYLCLENKQTLQLLIKQYDGNNQETQCLDDDALTSVSLVVNDGYKEGNNFTLETSLVRNFDIVQWYKHKYETIKNNFVTKEKKVRENIKCETNIKRIPQTKLSCALVESTQNMEILPELDSFPKSNDDNLMDYEQYVRRFKSKQKKYLVQKNVEKTIQYDLLRCTWDKIVDRQKEICDSVFSKIMLKQSQYEKQILSKLLQTENQINSQNENQTEVMRKINLEEEQNINQNEELKEEFEALQIKYENEHRKVIELHNKLYKEKQELMKRTNYILCTEVIDSLVDVAVNTSHYQQKYGENVPKILWDSWKVMFCKSQPVHIPFEALENDITQQEGVNYDEIIECEKELDFVVRNNDVDEYLHTCGRWFYKEICLELGNLNENVLANLIYRVITVKYPPPQQPLPADIPPFQVSGVLVNFHSTECVDKLRILLEKQNIHIFDVNTAVKKSISLFEKETNQTPPRDNSQTKTKKVKLNKNKTGPDNTKSNIKKKGLNKEKEKKINSNKISMYDTDERSNDLVDKETQTSIPKDNDENLPFTQTPLGMLGEDVFNILKEGRSVEDDLIVKVIVEYLKTLGEYSGWLLLNYPENVQQATKLELALTGKKIPKTYFIKDEILIASKEDLEIDDNYVNRTSKLLSFPNDQILLPPFKTYFTIFGNTTSQNQTEPDSKNYSDEEVKGVNTIEINDLHNIYKDQNIYQEFSFDSWDLASIKALARVILGVNDKEEKGSVELFGEDALAKLTKGKGKNKMGKTPSSKGKEKIKRNKKESIRTLNNLGDDLPATNGSAIKLEPFDTTVQKDQNILKLPVSPNDEDWRFVSLPLSDELSNTIATIWENLEGSYLQTLNDILYEIRVVHLRLIPYVTYIKEIMNNVVRKPDVRQHLVNIFIDYYNEVEDKVKIIPDVKSYLHCKVFELQQSLWEIMDERKHFVESNRQKLIKENWLIAEIALLINNYLGLVQNEYERSLKTFYIVNDYYFGMLNKVPTVKINQYDRTISKVSQEKLLNIGNLPYRDSKLEDLESRSTKISDDNFIIRRLLDCNDEQGHNLDLITSLIQQEINLTLQFMLTVVQNFCSLQKKEEDLFKASLKKLAKETFESKKTNKSVKSPHEKRLKNISEESGPINKITTIKETHKTDFETGIVSESENTEKELLFKEWKIVLETEMNRFERRIQLISQRAQEDILEFYSYLEDVFCDIYGKNLKQYEVNISNTNKLCTFLNTTIEEEVEHLQPITLNEKEFHIELEQECYKEEGIKELIESVDGCRFTVRQLMRLRHIFSIAGPHGVIRKQPLCYIIQDLMLFNAEDNQPHLPRMWNLLNESQLISVIDRLFGPEYAIDWRDFLIFNLEIPFPNIDEILSLRQNFLAFDTEHNEVVSFDVYKDTLLWFEKDLPRDPQEGLRVAMIKHLLFDMFKINEDQINYTALLLYFCKDNEPKFGFQKALCLSVGSRVIISKDELEDLILKESEVKRSIINLLQNIIASIVINREGVLIYEIDESSYEEEAEDNNTTAEIASATSQSDSIISDQSVLLSKYSAISTNHSDSKTMFDDNTIAYDDSGNRSWVSKIPLVTVSSILNASFLHQDKTFTLRKQYLNCLEEEADAEGMIEAHELVNLDCINNLFTMTNKFKITYPCEILKQCLEYD